MGKGRGKGGGNAGCCNAPCAITTTLIIVGIVGVVLVGGGIAVIVGLGKARSNTIKKVDNAVTAWDDLTAATGWRQFQQLNASVVLTPSSSGSLTWGSNATCQSLARTIPLSSANCPTDNYYDEPNRYRSVKQFSLCALHLERTALQQCNMQVSFQVQQPGSNASTNLVSISNAVFAPGGVNVRMNEIGPQFGCSGKQKCYGSDFNRCNNRCQNFFSGTLNCGGYTCSTINVYIYSLAIKLQYKPGASSPFSLDTANPSMGPASAGANVLPSGYTWNKPGVSSLKGNMWTYEGLSYGYNPGSLLFQIRSSSDPYLTYLAVTNGNGSFGLSKKAIRGFGAALLAVGGCCLLVVVFCCACASWGKKLARNNPTDKPSGCAQGVAWSWGRLMLGMNQPPSNNAVIPMAAVVQPVPPGGMPPPGAYYYPPQGAPPPPPGYYAYPPPPPGTAPYPGAPLQGAAYASQQPQPPAPGAYYSDPNQQQAYAAQQQGYGAPYYPQAQQPAPYGAPPPQPQPAAYPPGQFGQQATPAPAKV